MSFSFSSYVAKRVQPVSVNSATSNDSIVLSRTLTTSNNVPTISVTSTVNGNITTSQHTNSSINRMNTNINSNSQPIDLISTSCSDDSSDGDLYSGSENPCDDDEMSIESTEIAEIHEDCCSTSVDDDDDNRSFGTARSCTSLLSSSSSKRNDLISKFHGPSLGHVTC